LKRLHLNVTNQENKMTNYLFPRNIRMLIALSIITAMTASCQTKSSDKSKWPSSFLLMPEGLKKEAMPDPESEGARLTALYCAQCHGIPYPSGHSASEWVVIMRKMMLYMEKSEYMGSGGGMGGMRGMRGGMMGNRNMPMGMMSSKVPSPAEQKEILSYLQEHGLKTIQENELPEISGTAAEEFRTNCSKCHALPSPYQHTSEQWPAVVERMVRHTKDFHLAVIPDNEVSSIIKYLQETVKKN
jgi:mono/diheme cytochrome c family protein